MEVEGLKIVGQFIAMGDDRCSLVLREVKGTTFTQLMASKSFDEGKKFMEEWKPKVAAAAAEIAESHGILHGYVSAFFSAFHRGTHSVFFASDLHERNVAACHILHFKY